LSRLDAVTSDVTGLLESHLYGEAGRQLREFVWSELCDWYIETAKVRLRGTDAEQAVVAQTLAYVIERSLRLLHPYMPFVTETLWQELPHVGESVMIASWPTPGQRDSAAERDFSTLMELVRNVRNARAESNVEAGRWIAADVYAGERVATFKSARRELGLLARIAEDQLDFRAGEPVAGDQSIVVVAADVVATLPLAGMIDLGTERDRLQREIEAAELERNRAVAQLGNEAFVSRAPASVVETQRKRLAVAEEQIGVLSRRLAELGG
jgi:valyl-tRNA synthetase